MVAPLILILHVIVGVLSIILAFGVIIGGYPLWYIPLWLPLIYCERALHVYRKELSKERNKRTKEKRKRIAHSAKTRNWKNVHSSPDNNGN